MKQAHIQPVVFSSRNFKRRRKLSERGYFWVRYGIGLILLLSIYFWIK